MLGDHAEEKLLVINFAVPVPTDDFDEAFELIDAAWNVTRNQIANMYEQQDFDEKGTAHREWFGDSRLEVDKKEETDEYE